MPASPSRRPVPPTSAPWWSQPPRERQTFSTTAGGASSSTYAIGQVGKQHASIAQHKFDKVRAHLETDKESNPETIRATPRRLRQRPSTRHRASVTIEELREHLDKTSIEKGAPSDKSLCRSRKSAAGYEQSIVNDQDDDSSTSFSICDASLMSLCLTEKGSRNGSCEPHRPCSREPLVSKALEPNSSSTELSAATGRMLNAGPVQYVLSPELLRIHDAMYIDESAEADCLSPFSRSFSSRAREALRPGCHPPPRLRRPPRATPQREATIPPTASTDRDVLHCDRC